MEALLTRFELADAADRRAATYSGGMKRRLDLAMTLVSRPRVIFLDEPTTGLDPRSRRDLWQIVRELLADGVTVFLTTQYLEEADQLADTVGLLDAGRLVAEGTPAELKAQAGGETLDDVFLALTGHAATTDDPTSWRRSDEHPDHVWPDTTRDSATMLRRNLKHLRRYPSLTVTIIAMPVVFLLLFVYVFGGTMGAGLPGGAGTADPRGFYLALHRPGDPGDDRGVGRQQHRDLVAKDATEGIIDRFRTMPIARSAPLTGHVLAAMAQTALRSWWSSWASHWPLGYRTGSLAGRLGRRGGHARADGARRDLAVRRARAGRGSVEAASNAPMPLMLLPFLSSAFVPTDSMPAGLAWFAEHQPFTPIIETLRAFLEGRAPGSAAWWAVGWCVADHRALLLVGARLFGRVRAG